MDDSVIKVLRRNGSWAKSKSVLSDKQSKVEASNYADEEFSLDKNFGILAEEIKKRMKLKNKSNNTKGDQVSNKNDITKDAKKELLPLLKNIEALTSQRDNYSKKISLIDEELEKVKNNITAIKDSYEKDIIDLKKILAFLIRALL